jgi:hypothetical protein
LSRTVTRFEKYPGEVLDQAVDFTAELGADTIASAEIFVYDRGGVDRTSAIAPGGAAVNQALVEYTLTGGVAGELYTIVVSANLTTSGEDLRHRLRMSVTPPG